MRKYYRYRIVKENVVNGSRAKKSIEYYSNDTLTVGGLYLHLRDLKGAYRVLEELEVEDD